MENAELFWLIRVGFSFSPAGDNWGFLNGRKQDWLTFDQLGQADKGYIRLDESESVANIRIALVALKRGLPPGETDAMFVYDANSYACGSGGCSLDILLLFSDGRFHHVFSVVCGAGVDYPGVTLGSSYTNGMRNIRFDDAVTWIWNGKTYVLK